MIRFLADTWQEVILRPLAMAAPNAWVYIEIVAPDFRFIFAIIFVLVILSILIWKRKAKQLIAYPVAILFFLIALSFIPWMNTTGNGRYFMPYLILIGPLCVGLVNLLPNTKSLRITTVALMLAIQGFAFNQSSPWNPFDSWEWLAWKDAPYFSIELEQQKLDPEAVYITISIPTLSLVAPLFPATSRWINISSHGSSDEVKNSPSYAPILSLLKNDRHLYLIQTNAPRAMVEGTDQPNENAINAITPYLEPHDLALEIPTRCQLFKSKSIGERVFVNTTESAAEKMKLVEGAGLWVCPLRYEKNNKPVAPLSVDAIEARNLFEKMEKLCPRFFTPGGTGLAYHPAGFQRRYGESDSSLIATRDHEVYFKYDRALNPQLIGLAASVLAPDFSFDCTKFRGRAGLPWEREI